VHFEKLKRRIEGGEALEKNSYDNFLKEIGNCFHDIEFNGKKDIVYGSSFENSISNVKE